MYQHDKIFLKVRRWCATKTMPTLPVRPLAPFCVLFRDAALRSSCFARPRRFPLFFCWILVTKHTHTYDFILFYLFGRLYLDDFFFEEEWRREVWIFENYSISEEEDVKIKIALSSSPHTHTLVRGRLLRGLNRKTVRSVVSSSFERSSSSRLWWRRVGVGVVLCEVFCLRLSIEEEKTHPSWGKE